MAKRKLTPSKKVPKSPTLKKRSSTGKPSHGVIRKTNINKVSTAIINAVNGVKIPGADSVVPKIMGLLQANESLVDDLLNRCQQSHISNKLAEELFFISMMIENSAKETLRKVLIKSSATDEDRVEYLQKITKIDADFFVQVKPIVKRKYRQKKSIAEKDNTMKISQLEVAIAQHKKELGGIAKEVARKGLEVEEAKKDYFKAVSTFRKEYPIEDQDIESPEDYEVMVKDNTKSEKGKFKEFSKLLKRKSKDHDDLKEKIDKLEKDLKELKDAQATQEENELDYVEASSSSGSSSSESDDDDSEEDETALSQTQRQDLAETLMQD